MASEPYAFVLSVQLEYAWEEGFVHIAGKIHQIMISLGTARSCCIARRSKECANAWP
jgi:hypothetical protein